MTAVSPVHELPTIEVDDKQTLIDRVDELGEMLCALGLPPAGLSMHFDHLAYTHALDSAQLATASNALHAIRQTVDRIDERRQRALAARSGSQSIDTSDRLLDELIVSLRKVDAAAKARNSKNRAAARKSVIDRRDRIRRALMRVEPQPEISHTDL